MALRKITEARIVCANGIDQFKTLDGYLDDWNTADGFVESVALDIHLHCDAGAKEALTILDILTGFVNTGAAPESLWMEVEIRQEYAVAAADQIGVLLHKLESSGFNSDLNLKEMKRRTHMTMTKLEGLKGMVEQLRTEMQREMQTQAQAQAKQSLES